MSGLSNQSEAALRKLAVPSSRSARPTVTVAKASISLIVLVGLLVGALFLSPTTSEARGGDLESEALIRPGLDAVTGGDLAELTEALESQPSLVAAARTDRTTIAAYSGPEPGASEMHSFSYEPAHPEHFLSVVGFGEVDLTDPEGRIEVFLPIRPNGSTGWIDLADVELYEHSYRVEVDTNDHRLVVYEGTELIVDTAIGVGTGETPTPLGVFFTTDLYAVPDPTGLYGPFAFGLSGFSQTLTDYNGGAGIIGLHGTDDPGSLGTDVSHGCIRMHNDIITALADTLPLGTPVLIV